MSYILKNSKEADRLKRQAEQKNYSISEEVAGVKINPGARVLEIGCGAGDLISYLNDEFDIEGHGCDLQPEHIEFCKGRFSETDLQFFQHDILKSPPEVKYDHIFIRFVGHHLGGEKFKEALKNVYTALSEQGEIHIIDVDGLIVNLGTRDEQLNSYFETFLKNFSGDLLIGRRVPGILSELGFKDIDFEIQTTVFKGEERKNEKGQWNDRLNFGKDGFIEILGSEKEFLKFKELFLSEIEKEHIPLFFNKFIVNGKKKSLEII